MTEELYARMEAEFDATGPGDFKRLAAWIEWYMIHHTKQPILQRAKCSLLTRYIARLELEADAIYRAALAGELSRNEGINLFLPVCENMARGLTKLSRHLADDLESVAHQRLFWIFDKLSAGIDHFYGWLILRLQNKIGKFKAQERRAERFRAEASEGRDEIDADEMGRFDDSQKTVIERDRIEGAARDEIDLRIIELRVARYSDKEIAADTGLSTSAISLRRRNLESRLLTVTEDATDESIITLKAAGQSDRAIAKTLDMSAATIAARHLGMEDRWHQRDEDLSNLLRRAG